VGPLGFGNVNFPNSYPPVFLGLNTYLPPVLYDLYFLPPQFHFLSNLVPVVYEKTEMVPPSDFPSKTNVHPRHWVPKNLKPRTQFFTHRFQQHPDNNMTENAVGRR
jgi:hypothetical protein